MGWPQVEHYGYANTRGLAVEVSVTGLVLPIAATKEDFRWGVKGPGLTEMWQQKPFGKSEDSVGDRCGSDTSACVAPVLNRQS